MNETGFPSDLEEYRRFTKKRSEKVLIVDDEPSYRKLLARILEQRGYTCFHAENAEEAHHIIKTQSVDICLLDINMPGTPGDKLLKELRHLFPDVAFIMSTGVSDVDTAARCHDLGADDYLLKPFEPERLLISLYNVLERRYLARENRFYRHQMERKIEEQAEKLRSSQSMLIQQEKLAAIGQLAAGVAHEINNPLGFISSNLNTLNKYTERLKRYHDGIKNLVMSLPTEQQQPFNALNQQLKLDLLLADLPDLLNDSCDGVKRIDKIVKSLKSFSRTDQDQAQPVSINECIENAVTVVWNEIKYNAQLERDFDDLPVILGFPQQLSQVFMNLLVNAAHAISSNGLIKVSTQVADNTIIARVSDNGCGISPANLKKIFDPFFTTKPAGKGTGLGMSIACDIVHKHGGRIEVESEPGKGSTFTVIFPLIAADSN